VVKLSDLARFALVPRPRVSEGTGFEDFDQTPPNDWDLGA
jgi:hypothetical protein